MDQSRTLARPFRRTQPLRWWGAATILPQPDPEGAAPEGITTMTTRTTKPSNEDPNASTAQAVRALIVAPQDAARWEKGRRAGPRPLTMRAQLKVHCVGASPYCPDKRRKRSSFVEPYGYWGQVRFPRACPQRMNSHGKCRTRRQIFVTGKIMPRPVWSGFPLGRHSAFEAI